MTFSCCSDFSASGIVCQVRLLSYADARQKGISAYVVLVFVDNVVQNGILLVYKAVDRPIGNYVTIEVWLILESLRRHLVRLVCKCAIKKGIK